MSPPDELARFDGTKKQWRIDDGEYTVSLSRAADASVERGKVRLTGRYFAG